MKIYHHLIFISNNKFGIDFCICECVAYCSEEASIVRLGDFNYGSIDDDAQPINIHVSEVIVHPNFTKNIAYNNIALLRLNQTVAFNEYIRPACLSQPHTTTITRAMVAGWLFKLYHLPMAALQQQDRQIRKYDVNIISMDSCEKLFAPHRIDVMPDGLNDTMLCASIVDELGNSEANQFKMLRPLEVSSRL